MIPSDVWAHPPYEPENPHEARAWEEHMDELQAAAEAAEALSWLCPEHPEAQILHEWTQYRSEVNWGPYRLRVTISEGDRDHTYSCNVCGRQLAPPDDA